MQLVDLELGVHGQAWAVAHILNGYNGSFEDEDDDKLLIHSQTSAWYNGRERGLCFTYTDFKQTLHLIVYEHRNSDSICCIKWRTDKGCGINPPAINDIPESVYPDKYTYAHQENHDGAGRMAVWLFDQIKAFIEELKAAK